MSRRNHTTELGCIAGEDLSDLGAGKEGWLVDNPNLLVSLDTHSLAIANRSFILLLNWSQLINGNPNSDTNHPVKIIPDLSPIESEYISAVEWLVFDDDIRVLAVGTSCGYLLIFSIHGRLIHRQIVNPGKILKLRVRGIKQDISQDTSSEEVCVVMPGVVARFEGSDIKNLLQKWFQETQSQFWDHDFNDSIADDSGSTDASLPYQLWNVSKYGSCADAAITGVMPPPLMEIPSSQRYYCAVTIGDDAVISAFRLSVDNSRSLVGAILSKVVPATFSTIASFSKLFWQSGQKNTKKPEAKSQPFARGEEIMLGCWLQSLITTFSVLPVNKRSKTDILDSLLCDYRFNKDFKIAGPPRCHATIPTNDIYFVAASPLTCLKDHPRKGEKLTLSPSGTLAAITDSLGRILLLDTQALIVVRLWKGYREASCLFVEMLASKDRASPNPAYNVHSKSDYCLCLAIHAPRKGIVEVWQMRTGPRLLTIPCPKGSKILQPTYRFTSSASSSSYAPLEVFFLNGDSGQISVLNRFLH